MHPFAPGTGGCPRGRSSNPAGPCSRRRRREPPLEHQVFDRQRERREGHAFPESPTSPPTPEPIHQPAGGSATGGDNGSSAGRAGAGRSSTVGGGGGAGVGLDGGGGGAGFGGGGLGAAVGVSVDDYRKAPRFDRAERDRFEMQLPEIWSTRSDSPPSGMVKALRASFAALRPFG